VRLFVAVLPTDEVRADLQRRLAPALGSGDRRVRLTPAERWHVTLAFLGEVADERRADVERALTDIPASGPFTLRLAGGGRFGNGRSAAVWAGVQGDLGALTDLHAAIRAALDEHGLPYDDRPLTPHLTIAYTRENVLLDGYLGPQWTVDEFVLVRSLGGYQNLRAWRLS
jgi:2'-5' RNA ligase